jgi:hypothetical protein
MPCHFLWRVAANEKKEHAARGLHPSLSYCSVAGSAATAEVAFSFQYINKMLLVHSMMSRSRQRFLFVAALVVIFMQNISVITCNVFGLAYLGVSPYVGISKPYARWPCLFTRQYGSHLGAGDFITVGADLLYIRLKL